MEVGHIIGIVLALVGIVAMSIYSGRFAKKEKLLRLLVFRQNQKLLCHGSDHFRPADGAAVWLVEGASF